MTHDITTERDSEYQRRERLLRNSELCYRRLFEAAEDGILIIEAQKGTVININLFLLTLLGSAHAKFVDRKFRELGAFSEFAAGPRAFEALRSPLKALMPLAKSAEGAGRCKRPLQGLWGRA